MTLTFGRHKSIGEESYAGGERPALSDEPTFCVDPIGTEDYPHRTLAMLDDLPILNQMGQPISCMASPLLAVRL